MGISKWLARKGAVGGTARWAAKMYHGVIRDNPNSTREEILLALISIRYSSPNDKPRKDALIRSMSSDQNNSRMEPSRFRGLVLLVMDFLTIEASFRENSHDNRMMFIDIIREELEKGNIPASMI